MKINQENGNIQYLGSSIGNPYAGFNTNQMENKISEYVSNMNNRRRNNRNHINRREIDKIKHRIIKASHRVNKAIQGKNLLKEEKKENNLNVANVVMEQTETKKNLQKKTSFKQINTPNQNKRNTIGALKNTASEEIFNKDEETNSLNSKIANPPSFDSFIQTKEDVHFDKNFFSNLIEKSQNFNLETQRRGRRRSRFPDPQWDCAEMQIAKIVRYLCEEELSASYQKYCKPIFEQINTMVESFLYHDNNLEICQNLHMCPVSIDIHNDHFKE